MRKKLITFILLFTLGCVTNLSQAAPMNRADFISFMLSKANVANTLILQQRERLLNLYQLFRLRLPISNTDQDWLTNLAKQYNSPNLDFQQANAWQSLLERVDIIPNSLVVAQAINESAWGTSRFATNGNNYFGQWCYTQNCGLVPDQRPAGASFEVQKFPDAMTSVQSYMLNLNSNQLYQAFRAQRRLLRLAQVPIYGLNLTNALSKYSTQRTQYVKLITGLIKNNHLAGYDDIPDPTQPASKLFTWF